jgi:hypothetical protein
MLVGASWPCPCGSGAVAAQAQAACDRACLATMLDQYLAAVVKHDPKAAPLVVGFRQTENAINVPPGGGAWKTVTGLGKMQRRYFDTGQRPGRLLRLDRRRRHDGAGHGAAAGPEPQAHGSRVVPGRENDPGLQGARGSPAGRPPTC